jgi:hypothetical protein
LAVKSGKVAGFDDVYPEFIENSGQTTKEWTGALFNYILTSDKFRNWIKRAKVITILKPGKDGSDPSHFWPISLLRIVFKILERMILQRIQPLIDAVMLVSQPGFRKNRSCTEQVLTLTSHITYRKWFPTQT